MNGSSDLFSNRANEVHDLVDAILKMHDKLVLTVQVNCSKNEIMQLMDCRTKINSLHAIVERRVGPRR